MRINDNRITISVYSPLRTFPLKLRLLKIIKTRQTLANSDPYTRVKPNVSRYVQL